MGKWLCIGTCFSGPCSLALHHTYAVGLAVDGTMEHGMTLEGWLRLQHDSPTSLRASSTRQDGLLVGIGDTLE
jgi:hypothetical protein